MFMDEAQLLYILHQWLIEDEKIMEKGEADPTNCRQPELAEHEIVKIYFFREASGAMWSWSEVVVRRILAKMSACDSVRSFVRY